MKRFFLFIVALLVFSFASDAQLIWEDRFEYEPGKDLEGQGGWMLSTGKWTSGESPKVRDAKIKYSGYASSESCSVRINGTGINRITYRTIDESGINNGSVYVAMLINLESVDGVRDFITLDGGTGNSPRAKIFIKPAGTGFSIGASMSDAKTAVFTRGLAFKTPHLIVLKYSFVKKDEKLPVDNNDRIALFVNPRPELAENKQDAVKFTRSQDDKAEDMKAIKSVNIRQCGVSGLISGMRVAKSWNAAVKGN